MDDAQRIAAIAARYTEFRASPRQPWMNINPDDMGFLLAEVERLTQERDDLHAKMYSPQATALAVALLNGDFDDLTLDQIGELPSEVKRLRAEYEAVLTVVERSGKQMATAQEAMMVAICNSLIQQGIPEVVYGEAFIVGGQAFADALAEAGLEVEDISSALAEARAALPQAEPSPPRQP